MTDWKKKAEELPHYEPAHVTQKRSLEDTLKSIPGLPAPNPQYTPPPPTSDGGWINADGDLFNHLMARRIQQGTQQPNLGQNTISNSAPTVLVREGHKMFRRLEAASEVPIALCVGQVNGVSGREFEYKGIQRFYLLENQNEVVDISNLNPQKMINLAVVCAPFIGTLLVPENAIIKQQGSGPKILKD